MADDYDRDDYDDYDYDWLYIEDDYGLVDELAESQIPDPGYAGTGYEIDLEGDEFDLYNYWNDLEFADDPYWEALSTTIEPDLVRKRWRQSKAGVDVPAKRHKRAARIAGTWEPVIFCSRKERTRLAEQNVPPPPSTTPCTLFVDWQRRFPVAPEQLLAKAMPVGMRIAAATENAEDALSNSDEWEDEEDNGDERGTHDFDLGTLGPVLQEILQTKLGAAGLQNIDMNVFMQSIGRMMAGEDADDAMGELVNSLLQKLAEGNGSNALSDWLSGQGVSLEGEDDDAYSIDTAEAPVDSVHGEQTHKHPDLKDPAKKRQRTENEEELTRRETRKEVALEPAPSSLLRNQSRSHHTPDLNAAEEMLAATGTDDTSTLEDLHDIDSGISNPRKRRHDEPTQVSRRKRLRQPPGLGS